MMPSATNLILSYSGIELKTALMVGLPEITRKGVATNRRFNPRKKLYRLLTRPLITGAAIVLIVLAIFGQACASFTWEGGDWGGRDFTPANGDMLSGAFTNIGRFLINSGATVFAGSSLVSFTTRETVINGVFYGGSVVSPSLNIESDTTLTLTGALDRWSSITLRSGTLMVLGGSISALNPSGGTTVFTPPSGAVTLYGGGNLDLGEKGSGIVLSGPGGGLVWVGEGGSINLNTVPIPSALLLFAPCLAGILWTRRQSRKGRVGCWLARLAYLLSISPE